jgi:glycine dehydrogenase
MLRYLRSLQAKDIALDRAMIPLGSCTMKLNATTEMIPITWPELRHICTPSRRWSRPRAISSCSRSWRLAGEITGFDAVSLQPNAGSQGEYAGLSDHPPLWHESARRGRARRLPDSPLPRTAPTRPAPSWPACGSWWSAATRGQHRPRRSARQGRGASRPAGGADGHLSLDPWRVRGTASATSAPWSTRHGGQVYMDGANLNAMVGVCAARRYRRRCLPHEPAQDLLHPPWRRRARHGPDRRQGASGALPARPPG